MSSALAPFQKQYVARKAFLSLLGNTFHFETPDGASALHVHQRAFALKEDIVVYADAARRVPRLRIRARGILDVGTTYDVADGLVPVGACRRNGMRSLVRDSWTVLGPDGAVVAEVQEESMLLALVRRLLFRLLPQAFAITDPSGARVATVKQRFNPFRLRYDVSFDGLDPRLGVALVVLLLAVEGRQG
jgi:uncharacterized protein YxjI